MARNKFRNILLICSTRLIVSFYSLYLGGEGLVADIFFYGDNTVHDVFSGETFVSDMSLTRCIVCYDFVHLNYKKKIIVTEKYTWALIITYFLK